MASSKTLKWKIKNGINFNIAMRFKLTFIILLLLVSCNNLDINVDSASHEATLCVINATIEPEYKTRTSVDYFGGVSWINGDSIGIFGDKSDNIKFYLVQDQNGNDSFHGIFNTEKENIKFAYYPFHDKVSILDNSITYDYPDIQYYCRGNRAPMYGVPVSENTINFHQTGGVLLLKFIGLPNTINSIKISTDNESPFLSGKVVISDISNQPSTYRIENGLHHIEYILNDDADSSSQLLHLYVPLQIGHYNKLRVYIMNEDDSVYKELSLSDLNIDRGTLINTKTINCSDKVYYQMLPNEVKDSTSWDNAMITSGDSLITWKEDDGNTIITSTNLRNMGVIAITTDSIGNITSLYNDSELINIHWSPNGIASVSIISDNGLTLLEDVRLMSKTSLDGNYTRAGVDQMRIFATMNDAYKALKTIRKLSNFGNKSNWGSHFEYISDKVGNGSKGFSDEVDLLMDGKGSKNPYDAAIAVGAYAEKKINKNNVQFYNELCGATISNIEPTIINNQVKFGYSVRNTLNIPYGKLGYDKISRKCFTSIKKVPNGSSAPSIMSIISSSPRYGEREVLNDIDEYFYVPFEKGYTYYIVSRIELSVMNINDNPDSYTYGYEICHEVSYTSDISRISSSNISEIQINDIKYENNQVVFDFSIFGDFGDNYNSGNWGVDLYHNGKKVAWDTYHNLIELVRCTVKLNKEDFDCNYNEYIATAKGNWQLGSWVGDTHSELENFDMLKYTTQPSIIFFNPIIQKTETIQTRSSDDDDSEKYITFFSYGINIKGGFWIKQYTAQSDTEGPISVLSSNQPPYSDGNIPYDYSWTYRKDDPITPTLWYDITLMNGNKIQSVNNLKFIGCPMDDIDYENLFWGSSL